MLGCDDFSLVGKGRDDEAHPEQHPSMGVRDMLCAAGAALGSAIDGLRKGKALVALLEAVRRVFFFARRGMLERCHPILTNYYNKNITMEIYLFKKKGHLSIFYFPIVVLTRCGRTPQ